MRWTVVLQCSDEAGNIQTVEVLTLERDIEPAFSALGLLNREAKQLLLGLQRLVVRQQAAAFSQHIRPCPKCGIDRNIKDWRPRTLRSLFGNVAVRFPRYYRCVCEQFGPGRLLRYIWPGTKLLPSGTTPELMAMYASLGARMPYREAAFLLSGLLPRQRRCCPSTVRNHTLRVGARIDSEGMHRAVGAAPSDVDWASVAIDGTYAPGAGGAKAAIASISSPAASSRLARRRRCFRSCSAFGPPGGRWPSCGERSAAGHPLACGC